VPVINTLEAVTSANVGLNPFAIVEANDAVVANDDEVATLALSAFTTLLTVRANVEPSPLVNVVVALLIDAVVTNEPVFKGVTFKANEAVTAFCACEALVANDELVAVKASEAVVAVSALPCKAPTNVVAFTVVVDKAFVNGLYVKPASTRCESVPDVVSTNVTNREALVASATTVTSLAVSAV